MASKYYAVTLGEATMRVAVSRKTLAKWMVRLDIESVRHPVDYRYRTISEEAVARILATRNEMPWRQQQGTSGFANRRKNIPKTIPITHAIPLPDGWLALSTWIAAHHLDGRSVWRAIARGALPAPQEGCWQHRSSRNTVLRAYTSEQHEAADAMAAELWSQRFTHAQDALAGHSVPRSAEATSVSAGAAMPL